MKNKVQKFRELHQSEQPLLVGNVWDVQSAKAYENQGFKAIGTTSAGIAHSLGYEDGENVPFEKLCFLVERILRNTSLPLTVDLENGYATSPVQTLQHIIALYQLGAVGINIEDSIVVNGKRTLINKETFSKKIEAITIGLQEAQIDLFVNVRCDAFLLSLPNALEEAKARIGLYQKAKADGIFLPCLTNQTEIQILTSFTNLPINLMCMPDLPDFDRLQQLGVKRISMGNFSNHFIYKQLEQTTEMILENKNFSILF